MTVMKTCYLLLNTSKQCYSPVNLLPYVVRIDAVKNVFAITTCTSAKLINDTVLSIQSLANGVGLSDVYADDNSGNVALLIVHLKNA